MAEQKLTRNQLRGINVILVVFSGIAINQLSDLLDLQSSVIIVGSLIVVVAMLAYDHFSTSDHDGALSEVSIQVKWCLASLLFGALIGGCARLPFIPNQKYSGLGPFDGYYFYGYELGATIAVSLFASVAVLRKSVGFVRIVSFVTFAIAGLTLVIVWGGDETATFTGTFFTWLLIATTFTVVVSIIPEFFRLFAEFLGVRSNRSKAAELSAPRPAESESISTDRS